MNSPTSSNSYKPQKKPTLLIPIKRPLLPPHNVITTTVFPTSTSVSTSTASASSEETKRIKVHKSLNPSSVSADIQVRRPAFSGQGQGQREIDQDDEVVVEVDFSSAPQPFLDVEVRERWKNRAKERGEREFRSVEQSSHSAATSRGQSDGDLDSDERSGRGWAESEYGSMVVQRRKTVRSHRGTMR